MKRLNSPHYLYKVYKNQLESEQSDVIQLRNYFKKYLDLFIDTQFTFSQYSIERSNNKHFFYNVDNNSQFVYGAEFSRYLLSNDSESFRVLFFAENNFYTTGFSISHSILQRMVVLYASSLLFDPACNHLIDFACNDLEEIVTVAAFRANPDLEFGSTLSLSTSLIDKIKA